MKKTLQNARVEKDVENAYREELHKERPEASITSPHGTDGYAVWGSVRLLLEAKYNLDFKARVPICNTLGQCLLYLKRFEQSGEPIPNVILVGDKDECFVLSTLAVKGFLDLPLDWSVAPSKGAPELVRALVSGLNILPYVYDVDGKFKFRDVLTQIETLAEGEQRAVRATLTNIGAIFTYWKDRVFTGSSLTAVEQTDVFLRCLFQPTDVYLHPTKMGVLVVPGYPSGVPVSAEQYRSFFSHFVQGYKPSEIEAFYAEKDRLIEDDARRRQGAFFTPTLWVDEAHKLVSEVLGVNWKDECIVWDPAAGTGNLTRGYTFGDLIISTSEKPDVDVLVGQGYNPGAEVFQYDFLRDESDVLPRLAAADHRDVGHPHPEGHGKVSKGFSGGPSDPDLQNLGLRKSGLPDLHTTSPCPSRHAALLTRICEILKVGAQEQVVGVDASVTDRHPLGDVPVVKRPGKPVAKLTPNFAADPSVPVGVTGTSPLPALGGVSSGDVLPKPHPKSVVSTTGHRAPQRVEPVLECTTPNHSTSMFFSEADDKQNDLSAEAVRRLKAAAKSGKRLVFLMNPPYAEDGVAGGNGDTKKGVAATAVGANMGKMGRGARQLYAQFMFQASRLARDFGFKQVTVAVYCKPTFMCSGSYKGFRDFWYGRFAYQKGMLFQASHFADVSGRWGISFTIWSEGVTDPKATIPVSLMDVPQGTFDVAKIGDKSFYASDGRDASSWIPKGGKGVGDTPKFSSGLKPQEGYIAGQCAGSLGVFANMGNNLMKSGTDVFLLSGKPTHKGCCHVDLMPGESFRRAVALYGARKLVTGGWINDKDEYLAPTSSDYRFWFSAAYEQWNDDCFIYALLHNSNNCTAMRNVQYKSRTWTIHNHFFWKTHAETLAALDTPATAALYRDCKLNPSKDVFGQPVCSTPDPYLASVLSTLNLSPEAQTVLDKLDALWVKSLPHREDYAAGRPELHLTAWDGGVYQLKYLWRELYPEDWKDLQEAFKVLADKLRPGVYTHGFLLR